MKKLLFTALGIICFSAMTIAQEKPSAPPAPPAPMAKEQKMEMKAKQENDLNEAYTAAGLSAEEIAKAKEIYAETSKQMRELKADTKKTDEEKATAKKAINDEKTVKLKALMGAKYKLFSETRKKQKAAMEEAKPAE